MNKTVSIGRRPGARPTAEAIDRWIEGNPAVTDGPAGIIPSAPAPVPAPDSGPAAELPSPPPPVPAEPKAPPVKMKRLTIDIPDSLHRRVKSRCGMDGLRMADVIRELLDQRFPVP